ncbi:DNA invertase Pin-like site-specific DNA recombinase [Rhodobacter maris]|uniref:DNA invertase Pin-like site-specific DNA recombinase n=1 Tax=Rhodobacter maris TaxID=446682 RepID=A0A285SIP5_9RHOB|nr:DNA invertase Pin-like site-specific DNA recombinase [Rhodobacter maris]
MVNPAFPDSARDGPSLVRAAEYVRMSTDHQRYSTENQAAAIQAYAARRGMEIVRTYADEGKSGLRIEGRDALKRLIETVTSGSADFDVILVYDISRWGRFQDADESAYYEYICRRAGIDVHYCAEQFENDGSPMATMFKGFKRAMAGEYSRELSSKVFTGQCRLIEKGFRQGGPAGFSLRRLLIDQHGVPKATLTQGEHKSLQTDRVVLVPGPEEEVAVVREVYRAFVSEGQNEAQIADGLNDRGILTDLGRPWTRGSVHQLLINEKYIGTNVWNRVSFKLKKKHVRNDPETWIRAPNSFPAIVDPTLYEAAKKIIAARSARMSDAEMLAALQTLLDHQGALSGLIIDEADETPSSSAYSHRFGSLLRAYRLVGFRPRRDYRYIEINRELRRLHPEVIDEVLSGISAAGGATTRDATTDLMTVNGEFTLSLLIVRCARTQAGSFRWRVRFDTGLVPDISVVIRMDERNRKPFDYFLFPLLDIGTGRLRLAEDNGLALDGYRFDSLDPLYALAERKPLREVA